MKLIAMRRSRGSGVGVKSCTLTFRIFRRSHHVVNMRARSAVGTHYSDYPPSPAEGLTSNERSVALSLFRSVSAQPAAPDTLCVGYAPERRYLERRLQEIEKKWFGCVSNLGAAKRLRVQDQNKNQGEDLCNS
jgi:hypothetical protein